jgi:hypothetical protein
MNKPLGSVTFGTSNIRTDEYVMMAKVMVSNGETVEAAALTLSAWDDILGIIRIRAIILGQQFTAKGRLRKDSTLSALIDKRIDLLCDELKRVGNE